MTEENVQFLNTFKGKRVKLTLKTSSYIGVIQHINQNKTLVLAEVVYCSNGCKIPGSKLFFGHEILNVEFVNETTTETGRKNDDRLEDHLSLEKFWPFGNKIQLGDEEDDEDYMNFVVIDEFHVKFGPAIMHIKKQHVIGVGADGVEVFQHGRLCWLQIATKSKVYLFDILLLGARAFKNGLSTILENKHILKVIHDCRALAGCLIGQFGVKLAGVFDTQVADVMWFYSETGGFFPNRVSTLEEVLSIHLKVVPSSQLSSLQIKSQLTKEEMEMWQKRPCPVPLLKLMALSVIHLRPLRLVLLDNLMMDYMALVDSYINSSFFEPDELQHVSMESVLELPEELRKLEHMRQERQEWATKYYPVTEQGLLARFSPRSSPQTSPQTPGQGQAQADSLEPATGKSSPSTQVEPVLHNQSVSPLSVTSFSASGLCTSPEPAVQAPVPAAVPDLQKGKPPRPLGVGRGHTEVPVDTMGRGMPIGKEKSSVPALPTNGRGFLLQISQAQIPYPQDSAQNSTEGRKTPGRRGLYPSPIHTLHQEVMPQPGFSAGVLPENDLC